MVNNTSPRTPPEITDQYHFEILENLTTTDGTIDKIKLKAKPTPINFQSGRLK